MSWLKWFRLLALPLGVLIASCVEYVDVSPVPSKHLTPEEFSAHILTSALIVEPAEFERMLNNPTKDIEIPGIYSLYRNGDLVCEDKPVELQIKGTYSSFLPAKALGIKFEKSLRNNNDDFLHVPYRRGDHSFKRIKSFRLRNGGGAFKTTLIKDLAYARMVTASSLDVLPLYGEPTATYVNGAFYSLHNLRTENNENGVSRLLDIDEDRLSIANVDGDLPMEIKAGREEFWRTFENLVDNATTKHLLAQIDQRSFADFLITGSIFATSDWPYRNVRMYSVDEGAIRFIVFDFDASGEYYPNRSPYEFLVKGRSSIVRKLFEKCYQDPEFAQLVERRYDEVRLSGELSDEQLRAHLLKLANVYDPVIEEQIYRWGYPTSVASWYADMEATVGDYTFRYSRLPEDFR